MPHDGGTSVLGGARTPGTFRPAHRHESRLADEVLNEPCDIHGCAVDVLGAAGCGVLACPGCGRSGANLLRPAADDQRFADIVVVCSCGYRWQPYAYGHDG